MAWERLEKSKEGNLEKVWWKLGEVWGSLGDPAGGNTKMGKGEPGKSLKEAPGKSGESEVWGRPCKSFVKAWGKGLGKRTFGEEKS